MLIDKQKNVSWSFIHFKLFMIFHVSKYVFKYLQLGTYDAIAHFNIGREILWLVYEKLGIIPGRYTTKQCQNLNQKRLYHAKYKSSESARKRGIKKSTMDKHKDEEEIVYEAAAFWDIFFVIYIIYTLD